MEENISEDGNGQLKFEVNRDGTWEPEETEHVMMLLEGRDEKAISKGMITFMKSEWQS